MVALIMKGDLRDNRVATLYIHYYRVLDNLVGLIKLDLRENRVATISETPFTNNLKIRSMYLYTKYF